MPMHKFLYFSFLKKNSLNILRIKGGGYDVLEAGLEPAQPQWPRDFKSLVSTIPPFERCVEV